MAIFAEINAILILEHAEQRIDLVLGDDIGLLVDIEKDTAGRNCDGAPQFG